MSIGRSAAGVFASKLLNLFLSFGNSIFLTRALGVAGRGEFAVFSASFGLLSLFLGLGLDVSVRYYVAQGRIGRDRILTSLIMFVLVMGSLVLAVAHLNSRFFGNEFFLTTSKQSLTFELTLAGVVMANLFYSNIASVFAGSRSFKVLNILSVGFMAVSLAAFAGLHLAKHVGILAIGSGDVFLLYLLLTLLNSVALGTLAFKFLGVSFSRKLLDRRLVEGMLRYGSKAYAAHLAQFLNYRADIWIVQYFSGAAALGLYSLAASLAMMLWTLPRSTSTVLMPATAAKDPSASTEQAARLGRLVFLATAVLAVPAALSAEFWIGLLYGPEFSGAAAPFSILLLGCVPFSMCVVLAGSLTGLNRLDVNLTASSVGLVVTIILDLLLIPSFGITGAAVASAASYFVTTALVITAFSRISSLPLLTCIVPTREDLWYVIDGFKSLLR